MKHWHRCQRWTRRATSCPFIGDPEHQDTPDSDERLQFTKTPQLSAVAPVPVSGSEPMSKVSVRVPRPALPTQLTMAAERPTPKAEAQLPSFSSTPAPEPGVPLQPGKVTAGETVKQVMRDAEAAVGRPGQSIQEEDIAFLRDQSITPGSAVGEKLGAQETANATQSQMAEEAAAEAFAPQGVTNFETLRGLVQRPPPWVVAIPLLAEGFRQLRSSPVFKSAVPVQPGRVVPADIAPRSTPLTVRTESRAPSGPGQMSEARPAPRFSKPGPRGAPAMLFNAAERMRQLIGVSRRKVAERQKPFVAPKLPGVGGGGLF